MDPLQRPYLHPVRDVSGEYVHTQDRPADHPWQHGIFTGFHGMVNGHEYWMEKDGQHRFQRVTNVVERDDSISWNAITALVEPSGAIAVEEEDQIKVFAPEPSDSYRI